MEELRKSSEGMGRDVGEKLFNYLSSHSGNSNLPDLNDFINETTKFRIKRTLQSWNTNTLPPVVTHNIVDDYKDEILGFVRSAGLINKKDDRVKIVYHPAFISPDNPLFGMEYSEFVRGSHLGVFPSYYEPWGYTPCESLASGVPCRHLRFGRIWRLRRKFHLGRRVARHKSPAQARTGGSTSRPKTCPTSCSGSPRPLHANV